MNRFALSLFVALAAILLQLPAQAAGPRCLTDCRPRIGIVSAFGAEADLLLAETRGRREHLIHGRRFTTGALRGNPVAVVHDADGLTDEQMAEVEAFLEGLDNHDDVQDMFVGLAG